MQASRGKDAERVFNRVLLKLPEPKLGQLTEYGLLHAGSLLLALRRAGEDYVGDPTTDLSLMRVSAVMRGGEWTAFAAYRCRCT